MMPRPAASGARASGGSSLSRLWRGRALLRALVGRDLRTRYAGSSAGLFWAMVGPLLQIGILTTVFSLVLRVRFGDSGSTVPFAVVLAWGLFPWIAFQEAVVRGTTSLADNGVLLKRMAFPPEIVAAQPVFSAAAQLLVSLGLLLFVMPLLGVLPSPGTPFCLLPLFALLGFSVGLGWILGVLHVYVRDTAHVVVAVLQAWFYLTPIVYAVESAPEGLRRLLRLNPILGIVQSFRAFALGEAAPWGDLAWSAVAAGAMLAAGSAAMRRARDEMADLV